MHAHRQEGIPALALPPAGGSTTVAGRLEIWIWESESLAGRVSASRYFPFFAHGDAVSGGRSTHCRRKD
jgi:hypothetical protein